MTLSKEQIMKMAVDDLETILCIIGDLTHLGYKISLCKLRGKSLAQCAIALNTSKEKVRYYWNKCVKLEHDKQLRRIFNLN